MFRPPHEHKGSTLWILKIFMSATTDHRRGLETSLTNPLSQFLVKPAEVYPQNPWFQRSLFCMVDHVRKFRLHVRFQHRLYTMLVLFLLWFRLGVSVWVEQSRFQTYHRSLGDFFIYHVFCFAKRSVPCKISISGIKHIWGIVYPHSPETNSGAWLRSVATLSGGR